MGHQGLGHWDISGFETNRAAPHGAASVGSDVALDRLRGKAGYKLIGM
jgi:hypothetical protein